MPTGMGRKIVLVAPPGVNAFGTKISGGVLNTFTRTFPTPVHPYLEVAVTKYRIESIPVEKVATGSAISGLFKPVDGVQRKASPPGVVVSLELAFSCSG